jgi:DNA-directed RNA polymerase beta' subunit
MVMFFAFLTLYTTIVYNISRKQFSEELLEKERRNLMKLEDLLDILQQEVDKYIDEDKGY